MCGRITNHDELDQNARDFDAELEPGAVWQPSYNIAPTQQLPVLGLREGRRVLRVMRWGLIASWSKDRAMAARCINARAETVAEMPAYRAAFRKRRCLVLATGWYEWKTEGKVKRPHWFHAPDGAVLPLAGLWERWVDPATSEELRTCTVVTCAPSAMAAQVHDRMPVVLDRAELDAWMGAATPAAQLHAMLRACPDERIAVYEVDRRVGKVAENGPGLIVRAA